MDYTACRGSVRRKESSVRSSWEKGMRISNRGSDTERFSVITRCQALQQNHRNPIKKELGYTKQLD